MRTIKAVLLTVLFLVAGCVAQDSQTDPYIDQILTRYPELEGKPYTREKVKRIIDGDTFELDNGARVRLIGVNTPEITKGKTEHYGLEAKQYAEEALLHQSVLLFQDVSETDRYGRWLRYVFVEPDDQMFNETLVVEGYANTMTIAPDVTYADRFLAYEQEARMSNRGLWGQEEKQATEQAQSLSCKDPQIKGNINSRNERIYHTPDSSYYDATIAEMMFCTIEEAEEAGFRAPKR